MLDFTYNAGSWLVHLRETHLNDGSKSSVYMHKCIEKS